MGEVDLRGLLLEGLELAAGVIVALLEGVERGNSLAAKAERRGDLRPVELERCASLLAERKISSFWRSKGEGPSARDATIGAWRLRERAQIRNNRI